MKIVYLIGGVGAGKSTVLSILKEDFGAEIIQADLVAKALMEPGKKGYLRVVEMFGRDYLLSDGSIDRARLAKEVFASKDKIEQLNAVIHPMTWDKIRFAIEHSDRELTVVEAAIYAPERREWFDEVWYVYADPEVRIKRLMDSRGYSEEKCRDIIANQASDAEFRAVADRVIDNSSTTDALRAQLEVLAR